MAPDTDPADISFADLSRPGEVGALVVELQQLLLRRAELDRQSPDRAEVDELVKTLAASVRAQWHLGPGSKVAGVVLQRTIARSPEATLWYARREGPDEAYALCSVFDVDRLTDGSLLPDFVRGADLYDRLHQRGRAPFTPAILHRDGSHLARSFDAVADSSLATSRWSGWDGEQKLHFLDQLLRAVAHAHGKGVVHGDLTPHKILVNAHRSPVLLGFGARVATTGTATGIVAPELSAGDVRAIPPSDVFSLGRLITMVLLDLPADERLGGELMAADLGLLPGRLKEVVQRATAMEARRRYPSALELRSAVEVALQAAGASPSRRDATPPRRQRPATHPAPRPAGPPDRRPLPQRGPRRGILLAGAAVFAVVAGTWLAASWFKGQPEPEQQAEPSTPQVEPKDAERRALEAVVIDLELEKRRVERELTDLRARIRSQEPTARPAQLQGMRDDERDLARRLAANTTALERNHRRLRGYGDAPASTPTPAASAGHAGDPRRDPSLAGRLPFLRFDMDDAAVAEAVGAQLTIRRLRRPERRALAGWVVAGLDDPRAAELGERIDALLERRLGREGPDGAPFEVARVPGGEDAPALWVARGEVTQALWEVITGETPAQHQGLRLPVEQVSWCDAVAFCNRLSERQELKPAYAGVESCEASGGGSVRWLAGRSGYRLPSSAEWSRAAGAGITTEYWSGDGEGALSLVGWFEGNSGDVTHEAGELAPNPFGLWDVHGNVAEWVWDEQGQGPAEQLQDQTETDVVDLSGPPAGVVPHGRSSEYTLRGGSFYYGPRWARTTELNYRHPTERSHDVGLRIVRPDLGDGGAEEP